VRVRTDNWIVGQDVMRAPDMTALIEHYQRFAAPLADRVIGRLAASASRTRDDSGESRMGNLVADAQRRSTGADVALVHPGHVRAGLSAGAVTYGRAFMAQPFGTTLVTMTLSGRQILDLLKRQWCEQDLPQLLHPSGISYAWSAGIAAAIAGRPCATATTPVGDVRIGSAPIAPAGRYRVTVDSGMARGTSGLRELAAGQQRTGGVADVAALEAHLKPSLTGAPLTPPALDRIARVP
jgi:5'-nucleotidase